MKILYCYLTADTEGSTIHIDSFMASFTRLGEEVVDAGLRTKPFTGNKFEWSLAKRISAKLIWFRLNLKILCNVYSLASRAKADLVLFRFMPNHQLFLPIFFLSFLYPVVVELNALRSIEDPARANWLNDLLDRLTLLRAKRSFVVSNVLKELILKRTRLLENKIAIIENGVDVDVFSPVTQTLALRASLGLDEHCVVGFVGSFKPWHGVEKLLEIAEGLRHLPIKFLLVGDGESKKDCEARAQVRGLDEKVVFTGFVPHENIAGYVNAMDIVMAPFPKGHYDDCGGFYGSALKIFEYMAMAKAIIAPPLGQIGEVIVDGESGRLIYSEDTEALTNEILRLYEDNAYRQRLGANARQRVETHYTWKVNAEKVRTLCCEALGQHV